MRTILVSSAAALATLASTPAHAAPAGGGSDERSVLQALRAVERAGLAPGRARVDVARDGLAGRHVRGREVRGGVPVAGTGWVVTSRGGRVVDVAVAASDLPGGPARRVVARDVATRAAAATLGTGRPLRVDVKRLLVPRRGRLADTYRVTVLSLAPAVAAAVDVDARTGRVARVHHTEIRIDLPAKVFNPSPTVTKQDTELRQPLEQGLPADADLDSPELNAERKDMVLRELDQTALATGRLTGPYVNVLGMAGYHTGLALGAFDVTRGDPRFEGLVAYAHIDTIQRYFQSLGFTGSAAINAESQEIVTTRAEGFDNSFYQPGTDLMLMGAGGVDDGEDAEVVIHELGHAIHHAQVPGWGSNREGGAMGEGFGDFLGAAYFAPMSGGFGDTCAMEWDATTYDGARAQPCLRRLDTGKRYPKDVRNAVHADGELWSEFLWRVRERLGATPQEKTDNVLRLLLSSHELLTPAAKFGDAVGALRKAAPLLGRPEWVTIVEEEATRTGFPLSGAAQTP